VKNAGGDRRCYRQDAGDSEQGGNTGNCADLSAVTANCGTLNKRSNTSKSPSLQIVEGIRFKVNPNPNSGQFELEVMTEEAGEVSILVTDLLGRTVLTQTQSTNSNKIVSIEMRTASAGQYILKAELNGQVYIKKVVLVK